MKIKSLSVICSLGILTLLGSCAKEGPNGPTGPAGPSFTGSISGHVKLYDKYGSEVTTGLSSVKLSLNGAAAINPNSTGAYTYGSITTGMYTITASDSAYASTLSYLNFVSGALNKDVKLSALPDSFVYSLKAYHNTGSANDSLVLTFKTDTRVRYCIVFANNTAAIGNLPGYYLWNRVLSISPTAPSVTIVVPGQDLTDVGMVSGARVYYATYSYVVNDASVYEDVTTGKNVYNAVNSLPVIDSAIVP